ncbi:MAG: phosphatidate cytidylyltransferase [bacterium]|nr:phosphatidate cytidylyltransferase [bacterium]
MSNLMQRIITGIIGAVILIVTIYIGDIVFLSLVALISIIGVLEFYKIVDSKCFKILGVIASLFISCLFFLTKGHMFLMKYDILLPILLTFFILFSLIFAIYNSKSQKLFLEDLKAAIFTIFGVFYVAWLFNHLILLRSIPIFGRDLVLITFIAIWCLDSCAYFVGVRFGKTKFSMISPKKSIEGSLAGFLACILAVWLLKYLFNTNLTRVHALIIGVLIGVFGQLGDLAGSLLKRSFDVKDSSSILPGHGGVLDRFDSAIFVAPVVYYYIKIFIM